MQIEAEAFLQRIRAYPDDDAPRLVFADWLDEHGDPRGAFIRVQLALAQLDTEDSAESGDRLARPERRTLRALLVAEQALLDARGRGTARSAVSRRGRARRGFVEVNVMLATSSAMHTSYSTPARATSPSTSAAARYRPSCKSRIGAGCRVTIHASSHAGEPPAARWAIRASERLSASI